MGRKAGVMTDGQALREKLRKIEALPPYGAFSLASGRAVACHFCVTERG